MHCNFLTKFSSLDPSFNRNILRSLYLEPELLRMRNYAITRLYILYTRFTTCCLQETYIEGTFDKWHKRQRNKCDHVTFLKNTLRKYTLEIPTFSPAITLT